MTRVPVRIDKYEIVRRLGSGGMGTVYLGRDTGLGREVAIKVLRGPVFDPDDELLARFLQEARATAKLRHTNIVTVYEVGQHEQQPFIVMEFVPGDSLAQIIQQRRALPFATKLHYLEQVCAGLHFAHRAGIVHRDIKPANLMVDPEGMVRILDFGIARLEDSRMTRDGDMIGTVNYMSPEQMLGRRVDHRSDIFAVGTVAYELVAYRQAFPGTMQDGLLQRLPNDPPVPLSVLCPHVDPELEALINCALEKAPDARQADIAHMQAAIAACRRRSLQQRGAAFEIAPAPPLDGLAPTLHRRRPRTDADEIRSDLEEAERLLQAGDPTSAVNLAERVIEKAPSSIEAHALLLRAQHALAASIPIVDVSVEPEGAPLPDAGSFPAWVLPVGGASALAAAGLVAALLGAFNGGEPRPAEPPGENKTSAATPPVAPPREVAAPPGAVPAAPPRTEPSPNTEVAIEPELERARALARRGSVPAAIEILEPLLAQTRDGRVRAALEAAMRTVASSVEQSRTAAVTANARERAAAQFAIASESAQLMGRAHTRNEYGEAARIGLLAAAQFEQAAAEATRLANADDRPASAPTPPMPEPSRPEPSNTTAPPPPATDPKPEPAPVSNVAPPTAAPAAVPPLERERPAILGALNQYRSAYRNGSVPEMMAVFPELPRERRQAYERAFKNKRDCPALDVQFGPAEIFLSGEDRASVTVLSTYICKPPTAQRDTQEPQTDVFQMRKAGDRWVITGMGAMK